MGCRAPELVPSKGASQLAPGLNYMPSRPLLQEHYGQFHDQTDAAITIDFEKCLKCGRCVSVCGLIQVGGRGWVRGTAGGKQEKMEGVWDVAATAA